MSFVKHRWRSRWTALLVAGALLTSILSPALPAVQAEEAASTARTAQYSDLASSYAAKEIAALTASGILDGFDDGTFRPAEPVTRAQFAKVIASILKLKAEPEIAARFRDVPANAWYAGYTGALVKEGITDGVSESEFAPDQLVTREELATFFMRALKLSKSAQSLPLDSSTFADFNDISPWAQHYVSFAYKIGLLQGSQDANNSLVYRPKAQADRQALARLAYELLENKDTYLNEAAGLTTPAASVSPTPSPSPSPSTGFMGGGGGFGGGGGGPTPSPTPTATPTPGPADGSTLTNLPAGNYTGSFTVAAGVTVFGPETGAAVISGKLLVNPGPSGELILRNVQAAVIHILSGSDHSVILQNVKVTDAMLVNTGNQGTPVRVLAQTGTAIHTTLVGSAAILEGSGGSAGEVVIQSHATGKTVELRGSINGTVRSTAPDAFILIRDGASVQSLIMEANGRVQADGNVSGYGIINSNVQVELSGSKLAVLKENTGKAAKTSIQALGNPSKLVLADQAKVLEAMSQYNALIKMNMADSISQQLKDQLQAAQTQMKALTKEEAEKRLGELPDGYNIDLTQRIQIEKKLVAAQGAAENANLWGNSYGDLAGFDNWNRIEKSNLFNRLALLSGNYTGDIAVSGQTWPAYKVSLGKFKSNEEFTVLPISEATSDADGHFLFLDSSIFPVKKDERFILEVSNPATGYSFTQPIDIRDPSGATVLPKLTQPYYEGDSLRLGLGSSTYDPQLILIFNEKGQTVYGGPVWMEENTILLLDGPVKTLAGETLTLYARSAYYSRGISAPLHFKVLANTGMTQQPIVPELYHGDFAVYVNTVPGARVTLSNPKVTMTRFADSAGLAYFELINRRLNQGEQVTVTVKEIGKESSTPVVAEVKAVHEKSPKPAVEFQESGGSITLSGTFPENTTLLLQWGVNEAVRFKVIPLGKGENGAVAFSQKFSIEGVYSNKLFIYAKTMGKESSEPQELTLTPQTRLLSVAGTLYTDSINMRVLADPGSLITLAKKDGTVVFENQEGANNGVINLDSMDLRTNLFSGETIYLTARAPGKHSSFSYELHVQQNSGKTPQPIIRGTLLKGMQNPSLSILSDSYKFAVEVQTPDGAKIWLPPVMKFGDNITLDQQLVNSNNSKLLVSIKEHGKEKSDPVEVPIYESIPSISLDTVTKTVYKSSNDKEIIQGYTEPYATVTVQTAAGYTVVGEAGILGVFQLEVPSPLLVPETLLKVTAQAKGLPSSPTVMMAVYAAQGETPKPVVTETIFSGGSNINMELEAPAGSFISIYNEYGNLLDSGYWQGEPGDGMKKAAIVLDIGQLNQTLKISAQLPGRNRSEDALVNVQTDWTANMTIPPIISRTQFDYPGGMTRITGRTAEPFTFISNGVVDIHSDANGQFELYVPTQAGYPTMLQLQAPGKQPMIFYVVMNPENYIGDNSSAGGSGGIIVGGGGGGGAISIGATGTNNP